MPTAPLVIPMKKLSKYISPQTISAVGDFELIPKGIVEGRFAGSRKSPFHGFSVEFAGHREYMPGDDPKHIDWSVYYKREKYFIKQYEAETNMAVRILVDGSESMKFTSTDETKLDYAAKMAVTFSYLVTRVRDTVSLGVFDERIVDYLPPSNALDCLHKFSRTLEDFESAKKTSVLNAFMDFAERMGRRELLIILSDLLIKPEELSKALARFRFDHHEVVLFHIMDPGEVDFNLKGTVQFKGLEGRGQVKMDAQRVRRQYIERFRKHCRDIQIVCEKNATEYHPARTDKSAADLLMAYIESRSAV